MESCLGECFAEHLNSEIVLQTVGDVSQAVAWLRTTFLYIRVRGCSTGDCPHIVMLQRGCAPRSCTSG